MFAPWHWKTQVCPRCESELHWGISELLALKNTLVRGRIMNTSHFQNQASYFRVESEMMFVQCGSTWHIKSSKGKMRCVHIILCSISLHINIYIYYVYIYILYAFDILLTFNHICSLIEDCCFHVQFRHQFAVTKQPFFWLSPTLTIVTMWQESVSNAKDEPNKEERNECNNCGFLASNMPPGNP